MDIWQWIFEVDQQLRDNGQTRLADIIDELPSYTVNDEHDMIDAMVPEALSLARQTSNKWLEVFIRHWHLQSLVLDRQQVKDQLPEAIALLDFAHQEETKDCPQSVCVVQDLANCYANIDGPGYVDERLAVAKETLARIDPSWPCFECIATEYNDALYDAGRYEEILTTIAEQRQAILKATGMRDTWTLCFGEIKSLIQLKRYEEAERIARKATNFAGGEGFIKSRRGYHAVVLALQERYQDALNTMLTYPQALAVSSYHYNWCWAASILAKAEAIANDWQLNQQFDTMATKLMDNGVIRNAIQLSVWQGELAYQRGQPDSLQRCCQRIEQLIPRLNKDLGASEQLAQLQHYLAELPPLKLPELATLDSSETLLENLPEDPEQRLTLLHTASERWPQQENLILAQADTLDLLQRSADADVLISDFLSRYPDSPNALLRWGHHLMNNAESERFEPEMTQLLSQHLSDESRAHGLWLLALFQRQQGQYEQAINSLRALIEIMPDAYNALQLLARMETRCDDYSAAIQHWDQLLEYYPDEQHFHWDRMIPATLADEWTLVRESAKIIEMELEGDAGPIEENFGTVRIKFPPEDGEDEDDDIIYYARRTGPVSAVIEQIAHPENQQHFHDFVIFDAVPLNNLDQEDEQGRRCDSDGYYSWLYAAVKTKARGQFTAYAIDGVYPGDEAWQALTEQLQMLGVFVEIRSGDNYQLSPPENDPENDSELRGVYAYLAISGGSDLSEVVQCLSASTVSYEHPLIWPALLEALADSEGLQQQRAIEEAYGM